MVFSDSALLTIDTTRTGPFSKLILSQKSVKDILRIKSGVYILDDLSRTFLNDNDG